MTQVVIENPVINSPFAPPASHFRFGDEGITGEIVETRRVSSYFVPVAQPRKKVKGQLAFGSEWTQDRLQENAFINQLRERVALWRRGGYPGVTPVTRRLLDYWQRPDRQRRLFFCQIEALETAIYITEVAGRYGDGWIENSLRQFNREADTSLYRLAFKLATGAGKTVVMAGLIAWHTLNKLANSHDARFSDAFLISAPGITIRDRLRVLYPAEPHNYYQYLDLTPPDWRTQLGQAKIIITNFHAYSLRERVSAGKLTRALLRPEAGAFSETPDQMVRRVCRELGGKKNIVAINDEAHHCYRRKPAEDPDRLSGDERKEAERRDEEARIWISGLEAVKAKLGVKLVYDLSATPFFLRGSGYAEGTLFPWVVSDFSLIDAIECGIVKVPRVPVADNSMQGTLPTYRDIWPRIREHLPKGGRREQDEAGAPNLPKELEAALQTLYGNYARYYQLWQAGPARAAAGATPPVFIVVCNNTRTSKLVYDYIAGWEKALPAAGDGLPGGRVVAAGQLPLFNNEENGGWSARPNTILIDSAQLESGEAMSDEFKQVAAREIDEFKADYRRRFPGRDAESLSDEDLLREVMNTVGKPGKLGEQIKCVVSVSMLTEGWDANTVTHILGVRAFGTQLLCEQVVGRGLRRTSYTPNEQGLFEPEYAEVYGVPFSFIPCSGSSPQPKVGPQPTHVRALDERAEFEITFPRVAGYRYDIPSETLSADFSRDCKLTLSTQDVPTWVENAPIVGESSIHTLDELKARREQEVAFLLAKLVLEKYFRQDGQPVTERPAHHCFAPEVKMWLFPQVLDITRRWLAECVTCKDNAFPQMLLLMNLAHDAADGIYRAIVPAESGARTLKAILHSYDPLGSTGGVEFDTLREVYATRSKCHLSHVVCDSHWEAKLAQSLEEMDEVVAYVKNHHLGFAIPYTLEGQEHSYIPDFIARVRLPSPSGRGAGGEGEGDLINLIIEVSGEERKDKAVKVATARELWTPAVNNLGQFGRWGFVEILDPWDAQNAIRAALRFGDERQKTDDENCPPSFVISPSPSYHGSNP